MVAGYAANVTTKDTEIQAAHRFGDAFARGDTKTLYSFVPQSEREFYGLDQAKFDRLWQVTGAKSFKSFIASKLSGANSNGLIVRIYDPVMQMPGHRTEWQISGQRGEYFAPFFVANLIFESSIYNPNDMRVKRQAMYARSIDWLDQNRSKLEAAGFNNIRRGGRYKVQDWTEFRASMVHAIQDLDHKDAMRLQFSKTVSQP